MDNKLKPCPFCGGVAQRVDIPADEHDPNAGGSYIACQFCLASSSIAFGDKSSLVDNWNSRAGDARIRAEARAEAEEVVVDYRRLTRDLDDAINGADAAAAPSLCDIVAQMKKIGPLARIRAEAKAEARAEAASKAKSAILDFGKPQATTDRYSPMIRKDLAAQLAERAILAEVNRRIEEAASKPALEIYGVMVDELEARPDWPKELR